jgi:AcrR family transcriptional regulator
MMREPLRQRKKARTALTIEQVAAELFESHGFDATTIDQIADAADVHKQTVMRYFKTKEDIALARRNRLFVEFVDSLGKRTGSAVEHWRSHSRNSIQEQIKTGALRRWFAFLGSDDRLYASSLRLSTRYQEVLAVAFSEEAGVDPRSDIFAMGLAAMLVGGNTDVIRTALAFGEDRKILGRIDELIDLATTLQRPPLAGSNPPRHG